MNPKSVNKSEINRRDAVKGGIGTASIAALRAAFTAALVRAPSVAKA